MRARTGVVDMGMGEGPSDSGDSTEKHHQEECRRAAADRTRRHKQCLAMTGKGHWLVDAEARIKLPGEVEPPDLDQFPWEICFHVTVTGYNEPSCWYGPLLVCTSPVWLLGSKGSQSPSGARTFRAQDPGFEYGAPTADGAEEGTESDSKEHGNGALEINRRGYALPSAIRDEEDLKLRELMRTKEREPSTPLRRTVRVRHSRPALSSSHQSPLHCCDNYRAPTAQLPRLIRPDGHPLALERRTTSPYLQPASPFHSRIPPRSRTALPLLHPPPSRKSPGLTK